MTTLIVRLPEGLARQVAERADRLQMTHEELGLEAVRLFVRAAAEEQSSIDATSKTKGGEKRWNRRPRPGSRDSVSR